MVDWTGDVADNDEEEPSGSALAESVMDDINDADEETHAEETTEDAEGPADGPTDETGSDGGTEGAVEEDAGEAEGSDAVDDEETVDAASDTDAGDASADGGQTMANPIKAEDEPPTDAEGYVTTSMLSQSAPDAVTLAEAAQMDPRWTLLVWGDEGTGKSHFAHTAPQPICYLDTEGKAANLAEKFNDKEVVYFDATDYDAARTALVQSLDLLGDVKAAHGRVGTIVVDSMSKLWEFAQQKHVDEHYVTKESPADVTFKSGLQGGDDWKKIKKYHNARFRDVLAECRFHVVMTAMAEEDYNAVMEGADGKPMKPQGEKNNKYAVENIVRLRAAESGETVGDLLKTDRTRLRFRGLEWPEFDDVVDYIDRISTAELADGSVDVSDWDVDVVRGSPAATDNGEDDDDN